MPWMGWPSFLHRKTKKENKNVWGVNALNGATFISTRSLLWMRMMDMMCQCPEWGDLHFYRDSKRSNGRWLHVSMPWMGRPSFLHLTRRKPHLRIALCQCPEWGDLHFYSSCAIGGDTMNMIVSMPWMGRPSFLPLQFRMLMVLWLVCQCPEWGDLHFYPP